MATNNNSNPSRASPPNNEGENPFISFRRLIDSHVSSAIRSLNEQAGIPDRAAHPSQPSHQRHTSPPDEQLSSLFNIFSQPPLHGLAMFNHTQPCTAESESASSDRPPIPSQVWGCILKPAHSSTPLFSLCEAGSFAWWRHYSPYAPSNLVQDAQAPARMRQTWHRAFLDLLAMHNDGPDARGPATGGATIEELDDRLHATWDRWGKRWTDNAPVWDHDSWFQPYLIERQPHTADVRADSGSGAPVLEEDMYGHFLAAQEEHRRMLAPQRDGVVDKSDDKERRERFAAEAWEQAFANGVVGMLGSASESSKSTARTSERNAGERDEERFAESPIISMVTTSHTTTMPDGSSRTVRRFKKTFADGREESSEDVQDKHSQGQGQGQGQLLPAADSGKQEKKKGWFWN